MLVALYTAAGVFHLAMPEPFLSIMPPWVPFPHSIIVVTGICEIAGAIGLSMERWRRMSGIWLAIYAVCVFPANIQHALQDLGSGSGLSWHYHLPRLAFQPVLIWLTLYGSSRTRVYPSR